MLPCSYFWPTSISSFRLKVFPNLCICLTSLSFGHCYFFNCHFLCLHEIFFIFLVSCSFPFLICLLLSSQIVCILMFPPPFLPCFAASFLSSVLKILGLSFLLLQQLSTTHSHPIFHFHPYIQFCFDFYRFCLFFKLTLFYLFLSISTFGQPKYLLLL